MPNKKKRKYHKGITVREAAYPESYDEYLECIYRLEQLHPHEGVKNKEISAFLRVKAPSVSNMLQKLTQRGLIVWKPHGEIQLTEMGTTRAREMIEYHELTVNFLKSIFKMTDVQGIEKIACDFEHHFTPELRNHMMELVEKEYRGNSILENLSPIQSNEEFLYSSRQLDQLRHEIETRLKEDPEIKPPIYKIIQNILQESFPKTVK